VEVLARTACGWNRGEKGRTTNSKSWTYLHWRYNLYNNTSVCLCYDNDDIHYYNDVSFEWRL